MSSRVVWILALFGVLGLPAIVQASQGPTSPPRMTTLTKPVVASLVRIGGLPAVNVVVNGSHAAPFVIDTAANLFAVNNARVPDWNVQPLGEDEMGNPTVSVRELAIGDARFAGLVAAVDPFLNGHDEAGVLGVNIFHDVVLSLDIAHNKLTLSAAHLPAADNVDVFDFVPAEGGAPTIRITICGVKKTVGIDSAAPAVLRLPKSMIASLKCGHHAAGSSTAVGAQAGPSPVIDERVDGDLVFGRVRLHDPVVRFGNGPEAFLGSGALAHSIFTFDQKRRVLRVRPL